MSLFAKKQIVDLHVQGMTCGNCVAHVKKALEGTDGVLKADVSLEDKAAHVTVKAGTDGDALVAAVEAAGYDATPR